MVRANELQVNKCAMPMCGRISGVCQLWLVSVGRSVFFFFFADYILRISSSIGRWFCWHLPTIISSQFVKQVTQKKPNCRTNVNNSHSQQVDYVQQFDCCVQPVSYRGPCRPLRWKRLGSQTTRSLRHCKIITLKVILCRTNCMVSCKLVTFVSRVLSFVTQY